MNEITLLNGKQINMNFKRAFIYGKPGCGKSYITKYKINELLSESKYVFLCDVDNEYQFDKYDNFKRITRMYDDSYDTWIDAVKEFLNGIKTFGDNEAWFVIDDVNDSDLVNDILESIVEKNLMPLHIHLLIVSQDEPNSVMKPFFDENEIFNLSKAY